MKQFILLAGLFLFVATGCKQKSTTTDNTANDATAREQLLADDVQKTWKQQRETDASGDKESMDRGERQQRIIFYRNGNYTMTSNDASAQGKWTLDASKLSLQTDGTNEALSFELLELDKNTLRLRAADNSEMTLKPE